LEELGADAPDVAIKAYLQEKAPSVPQSQIGLALRKIRGRATAATKKQSPPEA
jgi:hypothetical protein